MVWWGEALLLGVEGKAADRGEPADFTILAGNEQVVTALGRGDPRSRPDGRCC